MRRSLLAVLLSSAWSIPARADCNSPPASWGSDWSAYESWCKGCCGVFRYNGTQSSCDPGPNWGCGGSSGGGAAGGGSYIPATVPMTMQGAVLQGIQTGIQQGLQNAARQRALQEQQAAEQRARQQAENDRAAQTMMQGNADIERDAKENAGRLEERRKAAADKAKQKEAERARDAAAGMRGLSGAASSLAPKDLSMRPAPPRPKPAPGPVSKALDCVAADAYAAAAGMGEDGKSFTRGLRADLAQLAGEFAKKPPSGEAGAVTSLSAGRDAYGKTPAGESQLIVKVVVTRDEATGEVRVDLQSSLHAPGGPEKASQNLIVLDRAGRVKDKEASPAAEVCLARIAR